MARLDWGAALWRLPRWLLLRMGCGLRDFGLALYAVPRSDEAQDPAPRDLAPPDPAAPGRRSPAWTVPYQDPASPGHPECLVPYSMLPEAERRWWHDLEERLR